MAVMTMKYSGWNAQKFAIDGRKLALHTRFAGIILKPYMVNEPFFGQRRRSVMIRGEYVALPVSHRPAVDVMQQSAFGNSTGIEVLGIRFLHKVFIGEESNYSSIERRFETRIGNTTSARPINAFRALFVSNCNVYGRTVMGAL